MDDLISRQATIDALNMLFKKQVTQFDYEGYEEADEKTQLVCDGISYSIECVMNLPSAQPEHTCVNCGRTVNNGGWYADGRTRCPIEEHYALPKDGYCHLWEKRNVTDDDYPEGRADE